MSKPTFYSKRVHGVRVRAQEGLPQVEVEVEGRVTALTPLAARSVAKGLQQALRYAQKETP